MQSKKLMIGYSVIFTVLFMLPLCLWVFGAARSTEEFEQRELAQRPVLSEVSVAGYPAAFEAYFNDTLPFRAQMIQINNRMNYAVLSASSAVSAIQGKDGWFFYNPGGLDGDPMNDYYNTDPFTEEQLQMAANNMTAVRDLLRERGITFVIQVIPNKASVYGSDYFPSYYPRRTGPTRGDTMIAYLREHTDLEICYAGDIFSPEGTGDDRFPQFYLKQDTHWNGAGAYVGVRQLLGHLDIEMRPIREVEIEQTVSETRDLVGLMSMSNFVAKEPDYVPRGYSDVTVIWEPEGEDHALRCHSTGGDGRKLMMIRDSFGFAMFEPLSTQFTNCVFVTHHDYSMELLEKEKPDILVYETVERFVNGMTRFRLDK